MSGRISGHQDARRALGRSGEQYAAGFYEGRGALVLGRNISYPFGELDLVLQEPDSTVVFAEVKTRATLAFGGAESVTPAKRRRLRAAATAWLGEHRELGWVPVRFDVVLLVVAGDEAPGQFTIDHYEGIFDGAR
ncbi:YraN family protein [Corynebacterium halotolerans]|uniref:YraN family protein n=1 Tax=Corynebacterium halotolerans TaxID=225326 RepID=UPI003CF24D1B